MITVIKKEYPEDWPDWMRKCPICQNEEIDSTITLDSESIDRVHFAIGKNCRKELAKKLFNPK